MAQDNTDHLASLLDDALSDLLEDNEVEASTSSEQKDSKKEGETQKTRVTGGKSKEVRTKNKTKTKKDRDSTEGSVKDDGPVINEEEMDKFFGDMSSQLQSELQNMDLNDEKINDSVPQIFNLIQKLLSKELLYPALKDLSPKFEEWLKNNSAKLSKTDRLRYKKQKDIVNQIIYAFDDETLDAQERFEKNLELMEKMQSLGPPPEELAVPEGVPSQCSIM